MTSRTFLDLYCLCQLLPSGLCDKNTTGTPILQQPITLCKAIDTLVDMLKDPHCDLFVLVFACAFEEPLVQSPP